MNRIDRLMGRSRIKSSWDSVFLKNLTVEQDGEITKYPYRKSDLVFVCISTTARAISQVPLKVMMKTSSGWEWSGLGHPVQRLLSKPNPMMGSAEELISSLVSYLLLDGHVFLLPFPPTGKNIDSLWVVRRENMDVLRDDESNQIAYWVYQPGSSTKLLFLPSEIGSIKFFNPYDLIWGFSPLEAGRLPLVNDYKAASYTSQFWDQGAVPGGVLETEKHLTEDRVERIRKQFLSEHEGYKKAHKVAVLEGGLKYQQIGLSQKDMEFIDLRKYNRDNILQIFGMKKAVISVTEDLNYATAKEERKEWWQDTNMPLMKLIEASLSNIIFPGSLNEKIIFDISTVEALHDDYTKRVEIGEILMKIGFTANEINERLELGFQPRPWRDNWYMPVTMVPMTDTGPEPVSMYPPPQQPGSVPGNSASVPSLPPPKEIEEEEEVFEVKSLEGKPADEDQEKIYDAMWKAIIAKSEPLEGEFTSKVRRCFFDMRKKTLALLNKKSPADVLTEDFLTEKTNLMKWTVPIYERGSKTGAASLADQTGIQFTFNLNDPEVLHFLTDRPLKVRHVVDTVKKQIAIDIHSGMEKNEPVAKIAARIKNTFNQAQTRAVTIARTEVGSSLSFGRSKGMVEMAKHGFTKKIWITAGDEVVRETHAAMHQVPTGILQPWVVGGSTLRFPADPAGAGKEVINCRCFEIVDEASRTQVPVAPTPTPEPAPVPIPPPAPAGAPTEFVPSTDFRQSMLSLREWMGGQKFDPQQPLEKLNVFSRHLRESILKTLGEDPSASDPMGLFSDFTWVDMKIFRVRDSADIKLQRVLRSTLPVDKVRDFQADLKWLGQYMSEDTEALIDDVFLRKEGRSGRAYYSRFNKDLQLYRGDGTETFYHEFGHHMEHALNERGVKTVMTSKKWVNNRSIQAHGERKVKKLRDITKNRGYKATEEAVIDDFISPYVGKVYPGSTEVFSMGLEQFASDSKLKSFINKDFEHFSLVYGFLMGVL